MNNGALNIGLFTCRHISELTGSQAACWGWLLAVVPGWLRPFSALRCGRARRRVRHVVRVGVGLPRHDNGEVHGVVTVMMQLWNSASVAVLATLRRMSQNDDAAMVFQYASSPADAAL